VICLNQSQAAGDRCVGGLGVVDNGMTCLSKFFQWVVCTMEKVIPSAILSAGLMFATAAHAENAFSRTFLAFSEAKRNAVWTELLKQSGLKCSRVVRTMFQGRYKSFGDQWSVGCADKNEYSVTLGSDASTRMLTCWELATADTVLSGGEPNNKMRCWTKSN
jgi:hypothetical protein